MPIFPFLVFSLILLTGCSATKSSLYPGTAQTPTLQEAGVTILGEVTACQGAWCSKPDGGYEWPLSLPQPPPAYTYQRAIRRGPQYRVQVGAGRPPGVSAAGEIAGAAQPPPMIRYSLGPASLRISFIRCSLFRITHQPEITAS